MTTSENSASDYITVRNNQRKSLAVVCIGLLFLLGYYIIDPGSYLFVTNTTKFVLGISGTLMTFFGVFFRMSYDYQADQIIDRFIRCQHNTPI